MKKIKPFHYLVVGTWITFTSLLWMYKNHIGYAIIQASIGTLVMLYANYKLTKQ